MGREERRSTQGALLREASTRSSACMVAPSSHMASSAIIFGRPGSLAMQSTMACKVSSSASRSMAGVER